MSTRAVYTFIDKGTDQYHVYKHHDGYPSGAAQWIEAAIKWAWPLPRFEACEFAASFVVANKVSSGGVYLTHHYDRHGDLAYRYEIKCERRKLWVTAYEAYGGWHKIFEGSLAAFELEVSNHE